MSNRKETPDLLGDILSPQPRSTAQGQPVTTPTAKPAAAAKPRKETEKRSSRSTVEQWAYMEVIVREFRGWRPRFVDGEELEDWREQPEIRTYLATLGADGWEMVGIMENKRNTRSIYFKRLQR